jgi:hypothetical protein
MSATSEASHWTHLKDHVSVQPLILDSSSDSYPEDMSTDDLDSWFPPRLKHAP